MKCDIIMIRMYERSLHMTMSNVASLTGSQKKYRVHPNAKRYTMRDNAFIETKNGNFQYERVLSTKPGAKSTPKLKVAISKDFSDLKLSTVAPNGIKKVDVFNSPEMTEEKELAEFYLQDFVQNGILEEVE